MAKETCEGNCGMHLCGKCAFPQIVFGVLFLAYGLNVWSPGAWFNGWTILGVYIAVWGACSMMMCKKR